MNRERGTKTHVVMKYLALLGILWGGNEHGWASIHSAKPIMPLKINVQSADLVIVGTLEEIVCKPEYPAEPVPSVWRWIGRLTVQEILKGEPKSLPVPLRLFTVTSTKKDSPPPIPVGQSGIWCLTWVESSQAYVMRPVGTRPLSLTNHDQIKQWGAEAPLPQVAPTAAPRATPLDLGFTWDPKQKNRLIVTAVRPSSPAAEGGFQIGDVIIKLENTSLISPKEFMDRSSTFVPGAKLKTEIQRGGDRVILWLRLPSPPAGVSPAPSPTPRPRFPAPTSEEDRALIQRTEAVIRDHLEDWKNLPFFCTAYNLGISRRVARDGTMVTVEPHGHSPWHHERTGCLVPLERRHPAPIHGPFTHGWKPWPPGARVGTSIEIHLIKGADRGVEAQYPREVDGIPIRVVRPENMIRD